MPGSFDHATIVASDLQRSVAFYDAAFGALDIARIAEYGDEEEDDAPVDAVAWGTSEQAVLWVVKGDAPTRHAHLRLRADSRSQVEEFHRAASEVGGRSGSAPRRWAIYREGEFSAVVLDPDGNSVEAVSAES